MDRGIFFRSLAVQALLVGALFAVLALALPKSFFEDYGWATGPVAWIGCSILTARILALPTGLVLFAALAGGVAGLPGQPGRQPRGGPGGQPAGVRGVLRGLRARGRHRRGPRDHADGLRRGHGRRLAA